MFSVDFGKNGYKKKQALAQPYECYCAGGVIKLSLIFIIRFVPSCSMIL